MAVHHVLLVGAVREMGFQWTAHNSAAVIFEIEWLVKNVRQATSLRGEVISEILRDLTYNPSLPPDVIYQPLIPIGHGRLMTIPLLILGSNPERNLLAVIDRLPWRADGALALKNVTEWRSQAPWVESSQVEQDLVISRALVEIFEDDRLSEALAFRGGTALYREGDGASSKAWPPRILIHTSFTLRSHPVHGRPSIVFPRIAHVRPQ